MRKINKILCGLMVSIFVIGLVSSCMSKGEKVEVNDKEVNIGKGVDVPDFYLNPPIAGETVYGVGSSDLSKLDAARKAALASARNDIASQIQTQIEASIVEYYQESGVDDNTQAVSFNEQISRQVTDATLAGTTTEKISVIDGTVYALVSFPKANVLKAAEEAFVRNEDAAFAEFKADEALKRLDAKLTDNPTKAGQ